MTNVLTSTSHNALNAYAGADPFAGAAADMGSGPNRTYMEFNGKEGRYYKGKDKTEVAAGTTIALDPTQFFRGWICWKEKQMMHEYTVPVIELPGGRLPSIEQLGLPDFGPYAPPPPGDSRGDGYREESGMRGMFNDGEAVEYKTSTVSAMRSLGNLLQNYGSQYRNHAPGSWPVVTIGFDKFTRKGSTDTQYAPVFKITGWLSPEQVAELMPQGDGGNAADYQQDDGFPGDRPAATSNVGADVYDDEIPFDGGQPQAQPAQQQRPVSPPPRTGAVPPRPGAPRPRAF